MYEVYFSVWGEDDQGKEMVAPGPGGLRFLQVTKPIILPSCALIPSVLDLPQCKPTLLSWNQVWLTLQTPRVSSTSLVRPAASRQTNRSA